MKKLHCGIDIHKESYVGCILDNEGKTVREHSFLPTKDAISSFLCGTPPSSITIAIEACGLWRAAYQIISELGYNVVLANPLKTHRIACNKKTDKVDARILADLLRTNYLPRVYIPAEDVIKLRDIVRHKCNITRLKVKVKNKIKSYLMRSGIKYPKQIWNERELSKLESLEHFELNDLIQLYRYIHNQEKGIMTRIKRISMSSRLIRMLMSHPGIGEYGAPLILAEIGDIKRFGSYKQLISYAGYAPGVHQSAEKSYTVKNNAVNKWLKWIICECSGKASIFDSAYMDLYSKVKKKHNLSIARREVARKMLRTIYYMLKNEEPYHAS